MNDSYKKLGINTLLIFIGSIGPRLVSFILMPFYTFWMTKEEFGIQDVVLTYSILLVPYFTLGLYEAVFVYPKGKSIRIQAQYFSSTLLSVAIVIAFFVSIIILLPKEILSIVMPIEIQPHLPYLVLIMILESFQRIIQSFTRGIDKMKSFSVAGCIHALVMFILAVVFVRSNGLVGFWISLICADTAAMIYNFISIRGWIYITPVSNFSSLKELLKYSVPLVPNATMWWIVNSINRPLLVTNVGLESLGIYAVAGKFPSIISLVFSIFFSAFQISAIEEYGKKNFVHFYNTVFRILAYLMLLLTCAFVILGNYLFDLFVDEKFHEGVMYLPILCIGVVLSNISTFIGVSFTITKESKYFLYSAIFAALIAVLFNSMLIPKYGIWGACISIVASQVCMLVYRWYKSYKIVNFDSFYYIIRIVICYSIVLFVYYFLDSSVLITIIVGAVALFSTIENRSFLKLILQIVNKK